MLWEDTLHLPWDNDKDNSLHLGYLKVHEFVLGCMGESVSCDPSQGACRYPPWIGVNSLTQFGGLCGAWVGDRLCPWGPCGRHHSPD